MYRGNMCIILSQQVYEFDSNPKHKLVILSKEISYLLSVELRGANAEETRLNGCGYQPLLLATNAQSRLHITPILALFLVSQ